MVVRVLAARGLIAADKGGTSDPYATVSAAAAIGAVGAVGSHHPPHLSLTYVLVHLQIRTSHLVSCDQVEIVDPEKGPIKLKMGKGRLRTETVKKTLEPAWKECSFPFARPPPGAVLKVTVLDDDLLSKGNRGEELRL